MNYLGNVPFNSDQVFVMGTTATGCKVYAPIAVLEGRVTPEAFLNAHKRELQKHLDRIDAANPLPEHSNPDYANLPA